MSSVTPLGFIDAGQHVAWGLAADAADATCGRFRVCRYTPPTSDAEVIPNWQHPRVYSNVTAQEPLANQNFLVIRAGNGDGLGGVHLPHRCGQRPGCRRPGQQQHTAAPAGAIARCWPGPACCCAVPLSDKTTVDRPPSTLAALYSVDERPGQETAGGHAQFSALRCKRSLAQDAYLGGFYVGREQGEVHNRVAGADGLLRVDQSTSLGFYALRSSTRHEQDEGAAAGHALGADFTRDTRAFTLYLNAFDVSKAFAADSGYLTRNGVTAFTAFAAPRFYPKEGPVTRAQLSFTSQQMRDAFAGIWEGHHEVGVTAWLRRAASLAMECHYSSEVFNAREFGTSGCGATGSMQLTKQVRLQGSLRHGDAIYHAADPFGGRSTSGSLSVVYQPSEQWSQAVTLTYADFERDGGGERLYNYTIARSRTTFQMNRYLFFRGIAEYNSFRRQMVTDLLGSFTYIPGTVLHAGYGSLYERTRWDGLAYVRDRRLRESRRGLFLKASYLWRL